MRGMRTWKCDDCGKVVVWWRLFCDECGGHTEDPKFHPGIHHKEKTA